MVTDADVPFLIAANHSMRTLLNPGDETIIKLNPDKITADNPKGAWIDYRYLLGYEAQLKLGSYLWPFGVMAMFMYAVFSYIRLKRRVSLAVRIEGNIYETDRIESPFVLGLLRPRIYIPTGIEPASYVHIVEHERTHIRRRDYLVSVLAFVALALHWFNPLVWVTYIFMFRDMESSCDEEVLRHADEDIRCDYSSALVSFSAAKKRLPIPLAFGEQGVKDRVKNVLNFKKPSRMIIVTAVALIAVLSLGFAMNRVQNISAEVAINRLLESVEYSNGKISFRIPADYPQTENWNILIAGREEYEDGFSMSDHFFGSVNNEHAWKANGLYTITIEGKRFTEMTMDVSLPGENGGIVEKSVDLLFTAGIAVPPTSFQPSESIETIESVESIESIESTESIESIESTESIKSTNQNNQDHSPPETYDLLPDEFPLFGFENLNYSGNHAIYVFEPTDGTRWMVMLSQPVRQGPSGIWCVEQMVDGNGNIYPVVLDMDMTAADYYADQQRKDDDGIGRGEGPYEGVFFLHAEATALRYLETREEYFEYRLEIATGEAAASLLMYPTYELVGNIFHRVVTEPNTIWFNQIEWLTDNDAERLSKLGNPEMPNGYYINDTHAGPQFYVTSEKLTVNIIDWDNNGQTHKSISFNELNALLGDENEYPRIWRLTFDDGWVIDITEQYRP